MHAPPRLPRAFPDLHARARAQGTENAVAIAPVAINVTPRLIYSAPYGVAVEPRAIEILPRLILVKPVGINITPVDVAVSPRLISVAPKVAVAPNPNRGK